MTAVTTAVGREHGYRLRMPRFLSLGHEVEGLTLNVYDLPEARGLDGQLGLNFLRRFNDKIRSAEGRTLVQALP